MPTPASPYATLFGEGLIAEASRAFPARYAAVTTSTPWRLAAPLLHHPPTETILVSELEMAYLEGILESLGPVEAFVGVGAGMAVDAAKYLAWRRGLPLFQIPTTLSSNAPFAPFAGVRNAPVRPIGYILPQATLVDPLLIRQAPRALNLAGVADILAVHTALGDWRLAAARGAPPPWNAAVAREAASWIDRTEAAIDEIVRLTTPGIRLVTGLYEAQGQTLLDAPNDTFLGGSEHLWVQNLERLTGRHFIHGEVVALGVLIGDWVLCHEPKRMLRLIQRLGIRHRPADLALSTETIRATLETLPDFLAWRGASRYSW
ncbi:MAG: iron-containing alcohol dehydrogenase, partial [Chloroflexi bacterium]|nr:iron-containing alcohol dehydrogenase [Chloroflexota bacterium]